MTIKIKVFWNVTSCSQVKSYFLSGGPYYPPLQVRHLLFSLNGI